MTPMLQLTNFAVLELCLQLYETYFQNFTTT
jgi:hypothetical protein